MYIKRHIEDVLKSAINEKGALCVTGAKQAGKSTVLKNVFKEHKYVTLDDLRMLRLAKERPEDFIAQFEPPVFIDEIQYATSLFTNIKMYVDRTGAKGAFVLSGSQRYEMMAGMTESLAGRINLIDLYGLSLREILNDGFRGAFIPTREYLGNRNPKPIAYNDIWDIIWNGFLSRNCRRKNGLGAFLFELYKDIFGTRRFKTGTSRRSAAFRNVHDRRGGENWAAA